MVVVVVVVVVVLDFEVEADDLVAALVDVVFLTGFFIQRDSC